jgi:hypothetical protein
MYISKGTAAIIVCILMLGSGLIGFYLMGTSLDSPSEAKKEKRTFLDAMAIFMLVAAAIIAGVFDLFPDE